MHFPVHIRVVSAALPGSSDVQPELEPHLEPFFANDSAFSMVHIYEEADAKSYHSLDIIHLLDVVDGWTHLYSPDEHIRFFIEGAANETVVVANALGNQRIDVHLDNSGHGTVAVADMLTPDTDRGSEREVAFVIADRQEQALLDLEVLYTILNDTILGSCLTIVQSW